MDKKDLAKFTANHDQTWAEVKGFLREHGSLVSYTLSKQLMEKIETSDLVDKDKRLINYFLMAFFTKALFEIEEGNQ